MERPWTWPVMYLIKSSGTDISRFRGAENSFGGVVMSSSDMKRKMCRQKYGVYSPRVYTSKGVDMSR